MKKKKLPSRLRYRDRRNYRHEYYLKHRQLEIDRAREWAVKHPEETKAHKRKYKKKHRKQEAERCRQYRLRIKLRKNANKQKEIPKD